MATKEELEAALREAERRRQDQGLTPEEEAAATRLWENYQRQYGEFDGGTAATTAVQGANKGLTRFLGAPVDLMNRLPEVLNILPGEQGMEPFSEYPVLGSDMLSDVLERGGMTYENVESVPPQYRSFAKGGEVFGESVPIAMFPFARGTQMATQLMGSPKVSSPFVQSAQQAPVQTVLGEAGAAIGAGLGRGYAEEFAPGNEIAGLGAELAGGIVNPLSYLSRAGSKASGTLGRFADSLLGRQGVQRQAAKTVQDLVNNVSGVEPGQLANRLLTENALGPNATAGLASGDPALLGLEATRARVSPQMRDIIEGQYNSVRGGLDDQAANIAGSGDPAAVQRAAQDRLNNIMQRTQQQIDQAQTQAAQLADRAGPFTPEARANANIQARNILDDAYDKARATESQLWGEIDQAASVPTDNLADAWATAQQGRLTADAIPQNVRNEINRVLQDGAVAGEMLGGGGLRSELLSMAADAGGGLNPNRNLARIYSNLAEAILEDAGSLPGAEQARAFSRMLNQRMTQGYPGRVNASKGYGEDVVPPEMTLETGVAQGGPRAALQSRQMQEAGEFGNMMGDEVAAQIEEVVRDMAANVRDPRTGVVNPSALASWRRRNRELLDQFPDLDNQLMDAQNAQQWVDRLGTRANVREQRIGNTGTGRVAQFGPDNMSGAMASIRGSKTPVEDFRSVARTAQQSGAEAVGGLRRALLADVFQTSTSRGALDAQSLRNFIDGPVAAVARETGVLSPVHDRNLRILADKAEQVANATSFRGDVGAVLSDTDALTDLILRASGSTLATRGVFSGITGGGNQLIIAQAGSQTLRRMIDKMPRQKVMDMIDDAIQNPQLMADLLEMNVSVPLTSPAFQRINAYMIQAGYLTEEEYRQIQNELNGIPVYDVGAGTFEGRVTP